MKLFGADVAGHAIIPFVSESVKIGAFGIDKKSSGLGDIEFSPLILGWHSARRRDSWMRTDNIAAFSTVGISSLPPS